MCFCHVKNCYFHLQQPLRDEELIRDRHNIVECLVEASTARTTLYEDHLKRLPDILVSEIVRIQENETNCQ